LGQAVGGGPYGAHNGPQRDTFLVDLRSPYSLGGLEPCGHNYFTRQYIPEDNSELYGLCLLVHLS
jgi:hypothetical protein